MVVFILENVRTSLRGELSRWLFEVKAGVFTGRVSALVREELWQLIEKQLGRGSAVLIHSAKNEQGFSARILGNPSRSLVDIEGILLVKT
ncbi:type I-E CRISPR-associated endoribonuclease Cas2e [Acaryochloris marina]|uniref:type I-E CRISPR-associated endoribonuclease Cas2e n=1 Tax=Acaryochloris marina TaxID=155978 RepID=UPI0021C448E2|nr:type I-E CRISPR-associated endoribonuclease Cas2e [Acaryochloris marina]BDM82869.1 hypothetical protein AM10699_57300 [Acaryochloris marina MBIC10699]